MFFGSVQAMNQDNQNKRGKKRTRDESILVCFATDEQEPARKITRTEHDNAVSATAQKRPFINDAYTERRGEPKMLELCCSQCEKRVMDYQKDGPGRLLRCYLNRIHSPFYLKKLQYEHFDVKTAQDLTCTHCSAILGTPMIYFSENRPAFQLLKGRSFFKET